MAETGELFAQMLTEGIYRIRLKEAKTVRAIQDELGYALGRNGGSAIERWRKGQLPTPSRCRLRLGQRQRPAKSWQTA